MSELQFQQAYARLLTDTGFRQSVFQGDNACLKEYDLSNEQKQHLLQLNDERVEIFSELLITNRLSKAIEGLPLTTHLLGEVLWSTALEFNETCPPLQAKKYDEAMAFARFLRQKLDVKQSVNSGLIDVLEYEMNSLELRFEFDGRFTASNIENSSSANQYLYDSEMQSCIFPIRLLHNRILTFNHDVEQISEEINNGQTPSTIAKKTMHILFHVEPSGILGQDEINVPTMLFIEACDGETSLSKIIRDLARDLEQIRPEQFLNFENGCLNLCESMIERNVVGLTLIPSS